MEILRVTESYNQDKLLLIKGETIRMLLLKEGAEHCFIFIGGKLEYVLRSLVYSKCKRVDSVSYEKSLQSPEKSREAAARDEALRILIESQESAGFSPSVYIDAGAHGIEQRGKVMAEAAAEGRARAKKQSPKKRHLRRKSVENILSFVRRESDSIELEEKKIAKEKQKS